MCPHIERTVLCNAIDRDFSMPYIRWMPVIDVSLVAGIALTAAIFTQALRAVWPITILVQREVKPFACDLCMSVWSTLAVSAVYFASCSPLPAAIPFIIEAVFPAMGGCLVVITMTNQPVFPGMGGGGDEEP